MLTPYDDFPIHQTADPVAHPSSADPNHYDRYFFNGFSRNGEIFFGGAMAHYPNRGIIDGAFSLVVDGVQHSVFASGTMPLDRATEIGPIRVEVIQPLRQIRLTSLRTTRDSRRISSLTPARSPSKNHGTP